MNRFSKSLAAIEETPSQQELAQKRKAERDRAERERVAKLSAEEQRKYIERERKGAQKSLSPLSFHTNHRTKPKSKKSLNVKRSEIYAREGRNVRGGSVCNLFIVFIRPNYFTMSDPKIRLMMMTRMTIVEIYD